MGRGSGTGARGSGSGGSPPEDGSPGIQSVQRAATILSAFTVARPRLTLGELTARLGVSKPTAHRYTKALRAANMLRFDAAAGEYSLGPQILTLAAAVRSGHPIISASGPFLEELVREVNETVVLSVWDGDGPIVVRVDDNANRQVRISIRAGSRLSLESAQGRLFCAFLEPAAVPGLPGRLRRSRELRAELEGIRARNIALNTPQATGVRTIAAPVFRDAGITAAVAIVGTTVTVPPGPDSPMACALARVAASLTEELGSSHAGG
ncbi:IclR family transcriptional regulator [Actinomadura sp. 7K507]|uniref:IclR family transcriptional regulator n=1 Tax=Actinomadura sp. 7K507 TaxID=2530365 RepID=UPI001051FF01|nr:IclR family transcriptional regulator [Actinomadura sp. 7K507]TDC85254.1 IclR family transcriptional regulator [Actinomadura sp. 7K507]